MCDNELVMRGCRTIPEGTAPLQGHDLDHMLHHAEGWKVIDGFLTQTFVFEDHYRTMAFVNALAWISHREDHHPELLVCYNSCTVKYNTHTVGGLSENDFICAAKINAAQNI